MRRLVALAVTVAALLAAPGVAHAGPPAGKPAPSLGKFDVVQGESFNDLRDLKGRVVRLVFFATW